MKFIESRYWKLSRLSMAFTGLAPCESTFLIQLQRAVYVFVLTTLPFLQLMAFLTVEFTSDVFFDILHMAIIPVGFIIEYVIYYYNLHKVKEILEHIEFDWNSLTNKTDLGILHECLAMGYRISTYFYMCSCVNVFLVVFGMFMPDIVHIMEQSNDTLSLAIRVEYFVDQQKYYYFIQVHICIVFILGLGPVFVTECSIMAFMSHAFALFQITSSRVQHALEKPVLSLPVSNDGNIIYRKIVNAIKMHVRAVKFYDQVLSTFQLTYLLAIAACVISLSVNLYSVSMMFRRDMFDSLLKCWFIMNHVIYMFYANYRGQQLIEQSTDISHKIYDSQWYFASLPVQKLLLFMMRRSMKTCVFVVGGIFALSYQGFSSVINASFSYYTFLYSTK